MHAGTWADLLAQSIVHGFVIAVVVEALIRLWRIGSPGERFRLRLLAVVGPLVLTPVLVILCPLRSDEQFRIQYAVFTARHWDDVDVLGVPLFDLWLAAIVAAGVALLVMDLRKVVPRRRGGAAAERPVPPELAGMVREIASAMRAPPPGVRYVELATPILFCTGVRRPAIVVSRGTLDLLDAEELQAALAHEISHLSRRDPLVSWALMAARTVLFFNPAVQVVARAMARDAETSADDRAARVRDPVALASALLKLYRATHGRTPPSVRRTAPLAGALAEPFRRARTLDVERRCRRLIDPESVPAARWPRLKLLLAAGGITALLLVVA